MLDFSRRDQLGEFLKKHINFLDPKSKYQKRKPLKNELLIKAIGSKVTEVFDLTMGLGEEAWLLAQAGYQVTGIERDPFLVECLLGAQQEALQSGEEWVKSAAARLKIICGESQEILSNLEKRPECCYLDPMFEYGFKQTALPRLEMQVMRAWIQTPTDNLEVLLQAAIGLATKRVVIKRPRQAPVMGPAPHHQIMGKAMRYDIYVISSL